MKIVLTVGVYDLIHVGHVELFRKAKALGNRLVVAVQNSEVVLKYKPEAKLICSTEERMYMVKAIRYVDEVITYDDVYQLVKQVPFDIFVCGPDQKHEGFLGAKEIKELPRTEGISSSSLKEMIKNM